MQTTKNYRATWRVLLPRISSPITKNCRSSNASSPSTKQTIQKITSTFALPRNFFTEHFNHHSGRRSQAPITRRCSVLWIISESCDEDEASSGNVPTVLFIEREGVQRSGLHHWSKCHAATRHRRRTCTTWVEVVVAAMLQWHGLIYFSKRKDYFTSLFPSSQCHRRHVSCCVTEL